MNKIIDNIINNALLEDIPTKDITTDNLFDDDATCYGEFISKQDGILSGILIAKRVFELIDNTIEMTILVHDGEVLHVGTKIATISGNTKNILKGERVALNLMQRMSGVATMTRKFVDQTASSHTKILDTRKTTPNLRYIEKLAVTHGGGENHRYSLSDQVMIKDNHIKAVGGITEAVQRIKEMVDSNILLEVEVENKEQFLEAILTDCDIIMLDNMTNDTMRECVLLNHSKKLLEASGNMILERIADVTKTGVDYISVGALTHSYTSHDISLKFK